MSGSVTLILGGARSGKSAWAERLATRSGRAVVYIATATAEDHEMAARIARHRGSRPAHWRTVESPDDLAGVAREQDAAGALLLIDCLTLWVSNRIIRQVGQDQSDDAVSGVDWPAIEREILAEIDDLLDTARQRDLALIVVSNEVGLGIVPAYPLGRQYRDVLGRVNQVVARRADVAILMIAGIPLDLRRLARPELWDDES